MNFSRRKLPKSSAPAMRECPIRSVQPHAPMICPVYVYLKANEKFVSVKAPLDFFTETELDRLKSFETFYLPEFVEQVIPFRNSARTVRALLSWQPKERAADPPAPYEISDAVLRVIGVLWGAGVVVEPFFVGVFVNELCEPVSPKRLEQVRDRDIEVYERSVFVSSWVVFLALHLGYCDFKFLCKLRERVFATEAGCPAPDAQASALRQPELDELVTLARESIRLSGTAALKAEFFGARREIASRRIASRLERVKRELIAQGAVVPSIFGERGFADV